MSQKIKAIIFDAGGVVTEWKRPLNDFFAQYGLSENDWLAPAMVDEPSGNRGEIDMDEFCRRTMARLGKNHDWKKLRQVFPGSFTLIRPTVKLIKELKPLFKLALLTNAMRGSVQELDEKLHFVQNFDLVIDSSEVGMIKPEAKIFHYVCRQLCLIPQECLFVDDYLQNVSAAALLGFQTVHFTEPVESVKLIRKILKMG